MYINRHEWEDVVDYHKKSVQCWKEYEKRFVIYDNEGWVVSQLHGFAVPGVQFHLILVDRNEIVLHGCTKFSFLLNPVLITAGADYTS